MLLQLATAQSSDLTKVIAFFNYSIIFTFVLFYFFISQANLYDNQSDMNENH